MFKIIHIVLITLLYSTMVHARFATLEDTDIKFEKVNRSIDVKHDGSYLETVEIQAKIIKESGKDKLVSLPISYNASNSQFKILEAKTIIDNVEYKVPKKSIEDKPIASNIQGFDQINQVLIAFPKVQLNASVYLKFQKWVKKSLLKNFFDYHATYALNGYCESSTLTISSEIPLHIVVRDEQHVLKTHQSKTNTKFLFTAIQTKPIFIDVLDEPNAVLDLSKGPFVRFSTLKTWSDFGDQLSPLFDEVIRQPLPDYFKSIVQDALKQKSIPDQLNTVTSQLAQSLSYMGDWRSIKGSYVPRNLQAIAETRFGDCKDFAALTVAILRQLGFEAYPALVNRGMGVFYEILDLPGFRNFNHAIVYVKTKSGYYWVDPTNFTSFSPHIYPDIANRQSLVLFKNKPHLETIPLSDARDAMIKTTENIILKDNNDIQTQSHLKLSGWLALSFTGADLKDAKQTTDLNIIRIVTDAHRVIDWKVDPYHLQSRIVQPLDFSFSYTATNATMRSSAGKAFLLKSTELSNQLLLSPKFRVSDLYLGTPATYYYQTTLMNVKKVGNFSNCKVESPWFTGERSIRDIDQQGIQIIDQYRLLTPLIPNKVFKSPQYEKFQSDVYACFGDLALIFAPHDELPHKGL